MRRFRGALKGSGDLTQPLSAQAQTPSRPSGADKKQQPAKQPGGQGRSGNCGGGFCPDPNSRHIAANQHAKPLDDAGNPRPKRLTLGCRKVRRGMLLDEKAEARQWQKMVRRGDLSVGVLPAQPSPLSSSRKRGPITTGPDCAKTRGVDLTHDSSLWLWSRSALGFASLVRDDMRTHSRGAISRPSDASRRSSNRGRRECRAPAAPIAGGGKEKTTPA